MVNRIKIEIPLDDKYSIAWKLYYYIHTSEAMNKIYYSYLWKFTAYVITLCTGIVHTNYGKYLCKSGEKTNCSTIPKLSASVKSKS